MLLIKASLIPNLNSMHLKLFYYKQTKKQVRVKWLVRPPADQKVLGLNPDECLDFFLCPGHTEAFKSGSCSFPACTAFKGLSNEM